MSAASWPSTSWTKCVGIGRSKVHEDGRSYGSMTLYYYDDSEFSDATLESELHYEPGVGTSEQHREEPGEETADNEPPPVLAADPPPAGAPEPDADEGAEEEVDDDETEPETDDEADHMQQQPLLA